jgi:GTP-sensing pleiotropic transcriptional regulator CodY
MEGEWWTRTQRIRTVAAVPFEMALVETSELPAYQKIARKALHLRELGLSDRAIAVRLGVTDKTAAKAIRWLDSLDLIE